MSSITEVWCLKENLLSLWKSSIFLKWSTNQKEPPPTTIKATSPKQVSTLSRVRWETSKKTSKLHNCQSAKVIESLQPPRFRILPKLFWMYKLYWWESPQSSSKKTITVNKKTKTTMTTRWKRRCTQRGTRRSIRLPWRLMAKKEFMSSWTEAFVELFKPFHHIFTYHLKK